MKFRLRFSVRTLAIVVALVCAYFAAWEATKRFGISERKYVTRDGKLGDDFDSHNFDAVVIRSYSPLPCVLICDEFDVEPGFSDTLYLRRYYLWLFGLTIKLPSETIV